MTSSKGSHDGHRKRMREKVTASGIDSLHDHEVLEMILYTCIPRKNTNEIAHALINTFGSLSAVLDANPGDLMKVGGIGEICAKNIKLFRDVAIRYHKDIGKKSLKVIKSSEDAKKFVFPYFMGKTNESFLLVCLNSAGEVVYCDHLFEGNENELIIHIRDIVEIAMRHSAASVIIAHNHPNKSCVSSGNDVAATRNLLMALNSLEIRMFDHIIVGGDETYSFAEHKFFVLNR